MTTEKEKEIYDSLPVSKVTRLQERTFDKEFLEGGKKFHIEAEVRWDDRCGNGHNHFAITGTVRRVTAGNWRNRDSCVESCGCIHEEIARHLPNLKHLIKWHLFDPRGPMHYVANTVYLAGAKDCDGLEKGEFRQFIDKKSGLPRWKLDDSVCKEKIAASCPDPLVLMWVPDGETGKGKDRELDAARRVACWPEATDGEMSLPAEQLKERLLLRLPAMIEEFRRDILNLGMEW